MYKETLSTELKEFFIPKKFITDEEREYIRECILSGKYYGNKRVNDSLKFMLDKYFLKYLSSWNHSDIDIKQGNLYFGIDDAGNICGIPYRGVISKKMLRGYVRELLRKTSLSFKEQEGLFSKLNIEVIKVRPNKNDTMKQYYYQLEQERKHIDNLAEYSEKYSIWIRKLRRYSAKLIKYLNQEDLRKEFIEFIEENNIENPKEIIDYINQKDKWDSLPPGEIKSLKLNPREFYFWITTFKDVMVEKVKKERPNYQPVKIINYENFYRSAKIMGQQFSSDSSINFFVIRITIPNTKTSIVVKTHKGELMFKRQVTDLGPCSTPLF